jgi:polyhydroxyalkanoate synthesis regulator phasin
MKRVMMVLGAVGALAIGLFAVAAVGAQEDVTDQVTRPVDDLVSRVADKLGVSEDEFVTAWNDSAIEIIDEKVEAGELDAEIGDMLKERIAQSDSVWMPHGPRHGHGPRQHGMMLIGQAAQNVLDTEDGELREAFADGKSLLDVALEKGFTEEQFTADLLAEIQTILDDKVADGDLDQEKADAVYDRISENIGEIISHVMGDGPIADAPSGLRFDGPRFGPRGFGGFVPFEDATDAATTDA